MKQIKLTCDRKVKFYKTQKNTFGLIPGPVEVRGSCPGCTRGKGGCWCDETGAPICYAATCARIYKAAANNLKSNQDCLLAEDKVKVLTDMLMNFKRETEKYALKKDLNAKDYMFFRWHWSGDIFSEDYAKAIVKAIKLVPGIRHWIYTRSFNIAKYFSGLPGVILYLSLDPCNWKDGITTLFEDGLWNNNHIKLCFMAKTSQEVVDVKKYIMAHQSEFGGDEVGLWLNDCGIHSCPVDEKTLSLEFGCNKCRQCLRPGTGILWFKT